MMFSFFLSFGFRFVRFVTTPEVLERVKTIEYELLQLEQVRDAVANTFSHVFVYLFLLISLLMNPYIYIYIYIKFLVSKKYPWLLV